MTNYYLESFNLKMQALRLIRVTERFIYQHTPPQSPQPLLYVRDKYRERRY